MGSMNAKPKPAARRARRASVCAALLVISAALSLPAAAQPRVTQGSLLVSTDEIGDASWTETVVLILHHGPNGTLGVAINRPTEVRLEEIVPDLGELPELEGHVFRGGPVQPTQLVYLVRNPPADLLRDAPRILEGVYASGDLSALPRIVEARGPDALRLYAGHVEWAPGQLDREIADERWTVTAGSAERVFSPSPWLLWQRLRNAGDELLVDGASTPPRAAPLGDAAASLRETAAALDEAAVSLDRAARLLDEAAALPGG